MCSLLTEQLEYKEESVVSGQRLNKMNHDCKNTKIPSDMVRQEAKNEWRQI